MRIYKIDIPVRAQKCCCNAFGHGAASTCVCGHIYLQRAVPHVDAVRRLCTDNGVCAVAELVAEHNMAHHDHCAVVSSRLLRVGGGGARAASSRNRTRHYLYAAILNATKIAYVWPNGSAFGNFHFAFAHDENCSAVAVEARARVGLFGRTSKGHNTRYELQ